MDKKTLYGLFGILVGAAVAYKLDEHHRELAYAEAGFAKEERDTLVEVLMKRPVYAAITHDQIQTLAHAISNAASPKTFVN